MKVINNFTHLKGFHCGSTALANVAGFHGHELSEAMCFGMGQGAGFFYHKNIGQSPSRAFNGRGECLEQLFFKNIGIEFSWRQGDYFPWEEMKEWLHRDVPVIIQTDLYYLDYFNTSTHFSGHAVVLAGYDPESREALLADSEREGLQRTTLDSLSLAMKSNSLPFPIQNNWREVPYFELPGLDTAIKRALVNKARSMLHPREPSTGLPALQTFSRDLPGWAEASDWKWCSRYAYQVIEKRGTGGSGFRLLYHSFLKEAQNYLPALKEIQASQRMKAIADLWAGLALLFKEISGDRPDLFPAAGALVAKIAGLEELLFSDILALTL
ncbi:MAG: BtrH N-terminal domain-containing protein [Desulfocucumaceae bacterium]